MIDRLIDIFINKPGIYSGSGRIAVVKTPDAVLDGAEIRDIFVTEGVGTGEFTLRNTKVTGTIYVNGGSLVTIAAGATVNKIEVSGNNVEVVVNGKVDTITVNASNVSISGEGDLATVFVESGTGNSVTVSGANVIVAEGAGQVDRSNGDIEQREEDREESAPGSTIPGWPIKPPPIVSPPITDPYEICTIDEIELIDDIPGVDSRTFGGKTQL
ncbi:MAG TPA: hypothetical protein GXZ88_04445, partial [Firmicutes bacterium]|nr:hypothetical protein [Candidatus Fermentithermobacillaceae bacterium]